MKCDETNFSSSLQEELHYNSDENPVDSYFTSIEGYFDSDFESKRKFYLLTIIFVDSMDSASTTNPKSNLYHEEGYLSISSHKSPTLHYTCFQLAKEEYFQENPSNSTDNEEEEEIFVNEKEASSLKFHRYTVFQRSKKKPDCIWTTGVLYHTYLDIFNIYISTTDSPSLLE